MEELDIPSYNRANIHNFMQVSLVTESEDIHDQFGAMNCCKVFVNVLGKGYIILVDKVRAFWSNTKRKKADDCKVSAYIKVGITMKWDLTSTGYRLNTATCYSASWLCL